MSSMKIPKWIGPALCPVILLLLIAAVCFYYCYWKPRREKNKERNKPEIKKKVISRLSSRRHSPGCKGTNIRHVDEEISYGIGHYDCDTYATYGPYCMDYCPLPSSGLSYCVNYDVRPKVAYCPRTSSYHVSKSRDTLAHDLSRCTDKMRKCRVRCPRGECLKCPDLPMITEGDSTLSLCDKLKEEEEQRDHSSENEQMIVEGKEDLEVRSTSINDLDEEDTSDCCRDSGFEDHQLP